MCVPVRPTPRRIRCDSSSRGSTSAIIFSPLIVNLIRRIGTALVVSSPRSSYTLVMSGRPFRRVVPAAENALDKRAHHMPLVLGTAAVISYGLRRRGGQVGRLSDGVGAELLSYQRLGRLGRRDRGTADPGQGDPGSGHGFARGLDRDRHTDRGEVADPPLQLEVAARADA